MKPNAQLYHAVTLDYLADCIDLTGLSHEELARRIGCTSRSIRYYLAGERPVPYPVMYAIESLVPESVDTVDDPLEPLESEIGD